MFTLQLGVAEPCRDIENDRSASRFRPAGTGMGRTAAIGPCIDHRTKMRENERETDDADNEQRKANFFHRSYGTK